MGVGDNREVFSRHHRSQKSLGAAPARAIALIHLEVGIAEIIAAIEFFDLGNAALCGGITPGIEDFPIHSSFLDSQFTIGAVKLIGAMLVTFGFLVHRQYLIPTPAPVAQGFPVIEIASLPAHVNHGIN